MLSSFLVTTLALAAAPSEPASKDRRQEPPAADPGGKARGLTRGYLRVRGAERDPLVEALSLRVPHLSLNTFDQAAGSSFEEPAAFIDLRREPGGPNADRVMFSLTIVVSDGRAFDRRIETRADDEETNRLFASTIANLLLAIEAGTVEADRGDVPLPTSTTEPCPACPEAPTCPEPALAEAPTTVSPSSDSRGVELGPVVMPAAVLGLGAPAQADRFAGAGVTVGLHARLLRRALVGLELRTLSRREVTGTRMVRLRVALGGGYRWRRGPWSLGTSLWATVEPWWLRGAAIQPEAGPLWGATARLTPTLYQPVAGGRMGLEVGPSLALSLSARPQDGRATYELVVVTEDDVPRSQLRVGGLELSMGVGATLWFALPRPGPQ